jgi:hypothetical protein
MENETQPTQREIKTEDAAAATAPAEQKSETPANESSQVTDPKATIKIEGQTFDLEAALAQEDTTLKKVLQPHFASIENANISREVKEGKLTVTIVKRAQHKGVR